MQFTKPSSEWCLSLPGGSSPGSLVTAVAMLSLRFNSKRREVRGTRLPNICSVEYQTSTRRAHTASSDGPNSVSSVYTHDTDAYAKKRKDSRPLQRTVPPAHAPKAVIKHDEKIRNRPCGKPTDQELRGGISNSTIVQQDKSRAKRELQPGCRQLNENHMTMNSCSGGPERKRRKRSGAEKQQTEQASHKDAKFTRLVTLNWVDP